MNLDEVIFIVLIFGFLLALVIPFLICYACICSSIQKLVSGSQNHPSQQASSSGCITQIEQNLRLLRDEPPNYDAVTHQSVAPAPNKYLQKNTNFLEPPPPSYTDSLSMRSVDVDTEISVDNAISNEML